MENGIGEEGVSGGGERDGRGGHACGGGGVGGGVKYGVDLEGTMR
jgi:hypothetical protein